MLTTHFHVSLMPITDETVGNAILAQRCYVAHVLHIAHCILLLWLCTPAHIKMSQP